VRLDVTRQGRTVTAAGHRIEVDAHVDAKTRRGEQHIIAVDFQIRIDGELVPALRSGVVGVDPTSEGARATAASEWAAQYGAPIGYAIARWLGVTTAPQLSDAVSHFYLYVRVNGELLHFGPPGFRGSLTDPEALSSPEFVQNIAALAVPRMGSRNHFRSATILLEFNGDTVVGGECRINGEISPALLGALKGLTLQQHEPRFLYKLYLAAAPRTD
jgi:hypothetical protein